MPSKISIIDAKKQNLCIKCKTNTAEIAIHHASYCSECLVYGVTGKVKNKIKLRKGDNVVYSDDMVVLLAYSGGSSSQCLLHILDEHQRLSSAHKKGCFRKVIVAHINESTICGSDSYSSVLQAVQENVCGTGFDLVCRELDSAGTDVAGIIDKFQDMTFLEDYFTALRTRLLLEIAKELECNVVLFGDNMTQNASLAMADMVKGRGFTMPLRMSDFDDASYQLPVARPLLDISQKEIDFFSAFHKYTTVQPVRVFAKDRKLSLTRATKDFVYSLQENYPSTAAAIKKTLSKAQTNVLASLGHRCILCSAPIEPDSQEWKSKCTSYSVVAGSDSVGTSKFPENICYGCSNLELDLKPSLSAKVDDVIQMYLL